MRVLLVSANTERIKMTSLPLGLGIVALAAHPCLETSTVPRASASGL